MLTKLCKRNSLICFKRRLNLSEETNFIKYVAKNVETRNEIYLTPYIINTQKPAVLIKMKSVVNGDIIMMNYRVSYTFKPNQVMETDVQNDLILNDLKIVTVLFSFHFVIKI